MIRLLSTTILAGLLLAAPAAAGDAVTQPVGPPVIVDPEPAYPEPTDGKCEAVILPVPGPTCEEPPTIQPVPEKPLPETNDCITIQPVPGPTCEDPPVEVNPIRPRPETVSLRLWTWRNGKKVVRRMDCGPRCPSARILLRLSRKVTRCSAPSGNFRAGGRYLGQRIGVFSQGNPCQRKVWKEAAPFYRADF